MKNFLFLIVITCMVISCNEPKAKVYACQEYSLDCELQKDHIMVLPIVFNPKVFDAFGYQMSDLMKKNQWYMISTKAKVLVPVQFYICLRYSGDAGCTKSTYTPTPKQLLGELWKDDKKICIDTVDLSAFISGLTKAVIVISGPNEIIFSSLAIPCLARPEENK